MDEEDNKKKPTSKEGWEQETAGFEKSKYLVARLSSTIKTSLRRKKGMSSVEQPL